MQRQTFYLICDESGAKGYSNKSEEDIDSLGLAVGLIALPAQIDRLRRYCHMIYVKYLQDGTNKFHITDLPPENQNNLRNDVCNFIIDNNLRLVYSSVLKQGMHQQYKNVKSLHEKIIMREKENGYGINMSDPKENMLQYLYCDAIFRFFAAIIDNFQKDGNFNAIIYSDMLDDKLLDDIKNGIKEVLEYDSYSKNTVEVRRYNYQSKCVEKAKGSIEFNVDIPESLNAKEFNNITFGFQIDESLAILPDVIANSLLYFAKRKLKIDLNLPISSRELISDYPLEEYFVSLSSQDDFDFLGNLYHLQ